MREFLSKCIAAGLSAGVVLLWWPILFEDVDTVGSWFVRGVAWTICFELLLLALRPVELALWETPGGERLSRRMGAAELRLRAGPARRRLGRLVAVAALALAVPAVLLATGLHERGPARAEAAPTQPIKVVRVTKVVRPIVKRVVQRAPISGQATVSAASPAAAPGPAPPRVTEAPRRVPRETVIGRAAPVRSQPAPAPQERAAPDPGQACDSAGCVDAPTAP